MVFCIEIAIDISGPRPMPLGSNQTRDQKFPGRSKGKVLKFLACCIVLHWWEGIVFHWAAQMRDTHCLRWSYKTWDEISAWCVMLKFLTCSHMFHLRADGIRMMHCLRQSDMTGPRSEGIGLNLQNQEHIWHCHYSLYAHQFWFYHRHHYCKQCIAMRPANVGDQMTKTNI